MTTLSPHPELIDRVRAALHSQSTREVRMFGGVSFMVNDALAVAVDQDGALLVRVDPRRDAELLARPYAARAEMGAGRSMGAGWIRVSGAGVAEPADLNHWITDALDHLARRQGARR